MDNNAQHHRYGASGAEGWFTCAGKLAMEQGRPDTRSPYAEEGSAAHYLASVCLLSKVKPMYYVGQSIICWEKEGGRDGQSFVSEKLPEGAKELSRWEVTDEMAEHVDKYVSYMRKLAKEGELFVEQRVEFGGPIGLEGAFGTLDAGVLHKNGTSIRVGDLKYGYSPVEAELNLQMLLYLVGMIEELSLFNDLSKLQKATLHIFQPRIDSFPEWTFDLTEKMDNGMTVLEWVIDTAKKAVAKSEEAIAELKEINTLPTSKIFESQKAWFKKYLVPSEKGCHWCKAKDFCCARTEAALQTVIVSPATVDDLDDLDMLEAIEGELVDPELPGFTIASAVDLEAAVVESTLNIPKLSFESLTSLYKALPRIESWVESVKNQMYSELMAGEKSPEYKLIKGREGNRAWIDPKEAEKKLPGLGVKKDLFLKTSLVSVADLEKSVKKAFKKEAPEVWKKVEEALVKRPPGKTIVVPASDPRPSLNPYDDALLLLEDAPEFDIEDLL